VFHRNLLDREIATQGLKSNLCFEVRRKSASFRHVCIPIQMGGIHLNSLSDFLGPPQSTNLGSNVICWRGAMFTAGQTRCISHRAWTTTNNARWSKIGNNCRHSTVSLPSTGNTSSTTTPSAEPSPPCGSEPWKQIIA
jgi:hypothetical protein